MHRRSIFSVFYCTCLYLFRMLFYFIWIAFFPFASFAELRSMFSCLEYSSQIKHKYIKKQQSLSLSLLLSFVHFLRHQKQIVIIWYIFVWSCLWQPSYGLKRWFYLFFSVRLISTQKFPLFATWIYEQIYQKAIKMKPNHMSHNFLNVSDACRHMRKWTESD